MLALQNLSIDNWQAEQRYRTLIQTLDKSSSKINLQFAKDILSVNSGQKSLYHSFLLLLLIFFQYIHNIIEKNPKMKTVITLASIP